MGRVNVNATIRIPADILFAFCRESMSDERWHDAYASLRPGRKHSARAIDLQQDRLVRFSIAAFDPMTGKQIRDLGYEVEYALTRVGPLETHVEISIEYTRFAAFCAAGLMKAQAQNDVLQRLASLIAIEAGYAIGHAERAGVLEAPRSPQLAAPRPSLDFVRDVGERLEAE